ncbi:MAG TPA: hypothetical protein VFV41_06560 [Streptosporangiaceae bacterium]|nr:hypothetical protein [Streptosporangiaceae bacterium]
MELRDATLMMLTESAGHPELERLARLAFDSLSDRGEVHYGILDEMIGEASGCGVLRALRSKYSPVAYEALIMPILQEIGESKPIMSGRRPPEPGSPDDPLTAPIWPG